MGVPIIVGNKNNIFTYTFTASTKTLKVTNVNNFPLDVASLVSVHDTTTNLDFNMLQNIAFSYAYTNGLPVYSWVFPIIPAASADGDTLIIVLDAPLSQIDYSALLQTNTATV